MRWSPFLPDDSGVSPLPYFSHASIDLQIWIPRSLTMFVFTTLLPLASIICANDHPRRLLRTCPRCRGLLVLGEEYSIITRGASPCPSKGRGAKPKRGSASMAFSSSSQAPPPTLRFRKPFTTLNFSTAEQFACRYSPISCAVCSGLFLAAFTKGNTTSVRLPSNSLLVFCSCSIFSVASMP